MSVKSFIKASVIFLVLFAFASCAKECKTFFDGDFEATVCYTRLGKEFSAVYTKSGGCEALEFLSPETLLGISAVKENGEVKINYDDLSFPSVSDGIFSPFMLLAELEAVKSEENTYICAENGITVLTNEGSPKEVFGSILGEDCRIEISNYKKIERSDAE